MSTEINPPNDSPFEIIFVLHPPFDVIFEDFVEFIATLLKGRRNVLHVCYHSHPALMLQMLLVDELVAAFELFLAEVEEGLRQLSTLYDSFVFGSQLETSVDFRF